MDYLETLEIAVTYIGNNLGDVSVQNVAYQTGYSYYHLTRLFRHALGESVGGYIKKQRLADGAQKLQYSNKRVIDIAIENGFKSSEAFSRAFKSMYKVSPIVYRKRYLSEIRIDKKQANIELTGSRFRYHV